MMGTVPELAMNDPLDRSRPSRRPQHSSRFLRPEELARPAPQVPFGEGTWAALRVQLEREGWNPAQIELVRDQLRQGWHLAEAKRNAVRLAGSCPLRDLPLA